MRADPNALVNAVLEYLRLRGILAWRNNTGATRMPSGGYVRFGVKGMPDIQGILIDGRFLAIECKTGKGRLSPEQKACMDNINGRGGLAFVARSLADVELALRVGQ
jgi:hypothetical protein